MSRKAKNKFSFIRYANCWEDAKILLQGLDIKEGQVGLSIGSGGDNSLALLLAKPNQVYVIDLNPTQLFCIEVKIKAIQTFPYDTLLEFLGIRPCPCRLALFEALKDKLSPKTYSYFKANPHLIAGGLVHAGKFEGYFQVFRRWVCPLFSRDQDLKDFCHLTRKADQAAFYQKHINNRRFQAIFDLYFGIKVMGALGRDASFYDHVKAKENVAGDIKARFEYGISHTANGDNPYLHYILKGNFSKQALPLYLRPDYYPIIKANLDRIVLCQAGLMDLDPDLKFDFFNLSDIFEYVSDREFAAHSRKLWHLAKPGARIAYWNMQNQRYLPRSGFVQDRPLSQDLFRQNQSFFYRDFYIYYRK